MLTSTSDSVAGIEAAQAVSVVVIDDSRAVGASLSAHLSALGVEDVQCADNGSLGLELLEASRNPRRILFCDLAMPGMDGVEVVHEVRRRGQEVAIVLISGKDRRVLEIVSQVARQAGHSIVGTLQKPFTRASVAELLRHALAPPASGHRPSIVRSIGVAELEAALAADRVCVVFEPQVRVSDGAPVAVEALVRLREGETLIPPICFLDAAESSGLILPLTEAVLRQSTAAVAQWCDEGLKVGLSVNLSSGLMATPGMPAQVAAVAEAAGLPLESLMVELTESAADAIALDRVIEAVARFRLRDIRVAIDDFGTGQSTLERLQRIPFTDLKIDRAFVTGAAGSSEKRSIIEYSTQLAHRLGLQVIAEGVETAADEPLLREIGCEMAQGYHYTRPLQATAMRDWLRRRAAADWRQEKGTS